ncbi:unnamed protein product [Choristocarpus tenellus]
MLLMGRKLTLQEALQAGLISRVVRASGGNFLAQVQDDVRRQIVDQPLGMESSLAFKRVMMKERCQWLLRVLEDELIELDRRFQAGHPQIALQHLLEEPRSRAGTSGKNLGQRGSVTSNGGVAAAVKSRL